MPGSQLATAAGGGAGAPSPPAAPLSRADRRARIALGLTGLASVAAALADRYALPIMIVLVCGVVFAAAHRWLLAWRTMVGEITLVILSIPIKRCALPVNLPLQLEPYRLLVLAVGPGLAGSLLIDERLKWRSTPFDAPIAMLVVAILVSVLTRSGHIMDIGLGSYVTRYIMF